MNGQTVARKIKASTFFTVMRADRKLSIPPGRFGKFRITHAATTPDTAARLSRQAMKPAPRTSIGWLRPVGAPSRTRGAEWGIPSETEIEGRVSCIVGRVQFQVRASDDVR